ncbi:MAG: YgjP-like metallopeptidase domain-containing protein [Eggerthella lenta]
MAAYGVVANFAFVASALFVGIAQGIQPLASNAYARGSDRDVRAVLRLALLTALAIAATTYAAVALAAEPLALAFNATTIRSSRRSPWTACACTSSGTSSRGRTSWRRRSSARWSNRSAAWLSPSCAVFRPCWRSRRAGGAVRHGRRVGHVPRGRGGHVRADCRASRAVRARAAPARSGGGRVSPRQRAARGRASASRPVAPVEPVELVVDGLVVRLARKRIKNLNLRVHRGGGFVEVSAPAYVRDRDIERFVRRSALGSTRSSRRLPPRPPPWRPRRPRRWRRGAPWWRRACRARGGVGAYHGREGGQVGVPQHDQPLGQLPTRHGRICINVRLALYPPECLEYVVVHELCHLLERGHGSASKRSWTPSCPTGEIGARSCARAVAPRP